MTAPTSIPSVSWRAIEPSDLGAVTDLLAAAEAVDHTGENFDVDDVTRFYQSPDIDPRQDSLLAEADGTVVAAGLVIHAVVSQGAYRVSFHARVHPAVRGRGLGEALLRWSLRRGVQMRRDLHPDLPGEVEHLIDEANEPASALCRDAGMTAVRWFVEMERDLGAAAPAVVEPAGTRIVGFHSRYDDVVRQAHNAAFAQHWGLLRARPAVVGQAGHRVAALPAGAVRARARSRGGGGLRARLRLRRRHRRERDPGDLDRAGGHGGAVSRAHCSPG